MASKRNSLKDALRAYRRRHRLASGCFWCLRPLSKKDETLDHVLPRGMGGRTRPANLVIACLECNRRRGVVTSRILTLCNLIGQGSDRSTAPNAASRQEVSMT